MKRLAVSAAGFLCFLTAACEPRFPPPEPPTYESFSKQGAPAPPPGDGASSAIAAAPNGDGESEEKGIYVRTSDDGSAVITETLDDASASEDGPASDTLYRWRDANGREHITDTPPPPGARLLGEISRQR